MVRLSSVTAKPSSVMASVDMGGVYPKKDPARIKLHAGLIEPVYWPNVNTPERLIVFWSLRSAMELPP